MFHPLLAFELNVATCTALGGLITVICIQLGKLRGDAHKDKRDLINDDRKQTSLDKIASTNESAVAGLAEIKTALSGTAELEKLRYETLLAALKTTCRHDSKHQQS